MATMSRNYEFLAMLNTDYSQENILSILENGTKFGCLYEDKQCNILNSHDALADLWKLYLQQSPPLIIIRYYKTTFYTWFYNRNNKIYLYLGPTHIAYKKKYDLSSWYGINFYRYQLFMLRIIGDNIITHFETYEYFDASYHAEDMDQNKKIYIKLYDYWAYEVYYHLIVNGSMSHITWLDHTMKPIDIKNEWNTLDVIIDEQDTSQCWYGMHGTMLLKFSFIKNKTFIIEPLSALNAHSTDTQKRKEFDTALRLTIALFKNIPVLRFITFKSDEDIANINKMDE